jgi:hypothetical protein
MPTEEEYPEESSELDLVYEDLEKAQKRIAELEAESRFFREQCPGAFEVYRRQRALLDKGHAD